MLYKRNSYKEISFKEKKLIINVLQKTIIAKFKVIENVYSDLPRINIRWKSNN